MSDDCQVPGNDRFVPVEEVSKYKRCSGLNRLLGRCNAPIQACALDWQCAVCKRTGFDARGRKIVEGRG